MASGANAFLNRTTQHYAGGLYDKDVWNTRNSVARMPAQSLGGAPGLGAAPGEWNYDWTDCFGDCGRPCCGGCNDAFCGTLWCPSCAFGANVHMLTTGEYRPIIGTCNGPCCIYFMIDTAFRVFCGGIFFPLIGCFSLGSCYACIVRNQIREKYNLPVQCELDCCLHYFCGPCAICQEYKELRLRVGGPVPVHNKLPVEAPTWAPPPRK